MKWAVLYSPGERRVAFWMVFSAIFFSSSAELLPIANWFTAVYSNAFYIREKKGVNQFSSKLPAFKVTKSMTLLNMMWPLSLGRIILLSNILFNKYNISFTRTN